MWCSLTARASVCVVVVVAAVVVQSFNVRARAIKHLDLLAQQPKCHGHPVAPTRSPPAPRATRRQHCSSARP